jgi:PAS domain S-box-containing protein
MATRILIVDDNPENLYLLESLLAGYGFEVISAENGEQALSKAHLNPPDLIVSDILMPVMDGYALCRAWKLDDGLRKIPFVFYTATYVHPEDEAFALNLGAERFILKPQAPDILMNILKEILEENHASTPDTGQPLGEEMEFFRQYNGVLFRKLEKKMSDLMVVTDELRTWEERYRLTFENVTDVIYIIDDNLKILSISPSLERLLGYKPEEFAGKHVSKLTHLFTRESFGQASADLSLIFKGEKIPVRIYEFVAGDGTIKYGEVNGSAIIRNGRIAGMVAVARDITGRKQAEERYRSIFENAQEGIYRSTPDGKFMMANQAMARILGYDSPEELIHGVTDIEHQLYVHPGERAKTMNIIEQQGFAKDDEIQFYRKDGSKIWAYRTMQAIRDEKGRLQYLDGMIEDITHRKNSIDQLRKSLGGTVRAIASMVEARDPYTAGHQRRVADMARAIAKEMKLPDDRIEGLHMAGTIHDIGKISVPAEILSSPKKLSDLEFSLIKTHAQSGYDILKDIEFPWSIARMVLEHHERMNGSGYPKGLTGDKILLESRILSVADVVEAMAMHRPYRASLGLDAALDEITKNRGHLFDPDAVDACLRLFKENGYQISD